jgi:hypothetical protein
MLDEDGHYALWPYDRNSDFRWKRAKRTRDAPCALMVPRIVIG